MIKRLRQSTLIAGLVTIPSLAPAQGLPAPSFAHPAWTVAQPFTDLSSIRELSNGSVLVAEFSEPAVYLISPAGKVIRKLGRKGAGPREYVTPSRLIPLPNDSTMLIDRDADRYLIIDPDGQIVATTPFPESMKTGGQYIRGADQQGRLHFQARYIPTATSSSSMTAVLRWDRKSTRIDSVAAVQMPVAVHFSASLPNGDQVTGMRLMPFTPADDWAVALNGRIAIVRASPYRVDWQAPSGATSVVGAPVAYVPVAVTEQDRKAREPNGPPFKLTYPATKPAFIGESVILDDRSRVWVCRQALFGAAVRAWDLFDAQARLLGTVRVPADKRIIAVTARYIYVLRKDDDDVQWLQAYAW